MHRLLSTCFEGTKHASTLLPANREIVMMDQPQSKVVPLEMKSSWREVSAVLLSHLILTAAAAVTCML